MDSIYRGVRHDDDLYAFADLDQFANLSRLLHFESSGGPFATAAHLKLLTGDDRYTFMFQDTVMGCHREPLPKVS
jgi:hypothetical protein